jgi:excisionase family DNA binding protein
MDEVAAGLALSKKALYHRVSRGQIPGVVRLGRSIRFRRTDLVRLLAERRGPSPEGIR